MKKKIIKNHDKTWGLINELLVLRYKEYIQVTAYIDAILVCKLTYVNAIRFYY